MQAAAAALHVASQEGHVEIVRLLLSYRANPFLMTGNSRSALHIAVGKGHTEVVKLLAARMKALQQTAQEGKPEDPLPEPASEQPESTETSNNEGETSNSIRSISVDRESEAAEEILSCPITKTIMQDPVVAPDGHTYEREAITSWLRSHGKSPVTQQPMSIAALVPNLIVKHQIDMHLKEHTTTEERSA